MIDPDLQNRMAIWRQKASTNTLSIEEMREAIAALRGSRQAASVASAKSRTPKSSPRAADDMLKDLL